MHRFSLAASTFPDEAGGKGLHDTTGDHWEVDIERTNFAIAPLAVAAMCTMPTLAVAAAEGPGPFQSPPFSEDPFTWILYKLIYLFALSWPAGIPLYAAYKSEILPSSVQAWMVSQRQPLRHEDLGPDFRTDALTTNPHHHCRLQDTVSKPGTASASVAAVRSRGLKKETKRRR